MIQIQSESQPTNKERGGNKTINRLTVSILFILLSTFCLAQDTTSSISEKQLPIHQLRIYEIFENSKAAFHERFRKHATRIMAKYDFHIIAIWESSHSDTTEFVYLLEWPDEQTMKTKWAGFMKDEEWALIKKETGALHGKLVGKITDRVLKSTDYSPYNLPRTQR